MIASFYLFLCVLVPVIIFFTFCIFRKRLPNSIFAEYFSGISIDRLGFRAFYNFSQCIRKLGYALLIMSCQDSDKFLSLGLSLALFHFPFFVFAICDRAYKRKMGNLIEIMVESVILGANIWLLVMHEEEKYDGNDKTLIGFYLLLGAITGIFLVILVDVMTSSC